MPLQNSIPLYFPVITCSQQLGWASSEVFSKSAPKLCNSCERLRTVSISELNFQILKKSLKLLKNSFELFPRFSEKFQRFPKIFRRFKNYFKPVLEFFGKFWKGFKIVFKSPPPPRLDRVKIVFYVSSGPSVHPSGAGSDWPRGLLLLQTYCCRVQIGGVHETLLSRGVCGTARLFSKTDIFKVLSCYVT